jgi:hypothetical protein
VLSEVETVPAYPVITSARATSIRSAAKAASRTADLIPVIAAIGEQASRCYLEQGRCRLVSRNGNTLSRFTESCRKVAAERVDDAADETGRAPLLRPPPRHAEARPRGLRSSPARGLFSPIERGRQGRKPAENRGKEFLDAVF